MARLSESDLKVFAKFRHVWPFAGPCQGYKTPRASPVASEAVLVVQIMAIHNPRHSPMDFSQLSTIKIQKCKDLGWTTTKPLDLTKLQPPQTSKEEFKKLALGSHPDKNYGNSTEVFVKVSTLSAV